MQYSASSACKWRGTFCRRRSVGCRVTSKFWVHHLFQSRLRRKKQFSVFLKNNAFLGVTHVSFGEQSWFSRCTVTHKCIQCLHQHSQRIQRPDIDLKITWFARKWRYFNIMWNEKSDHWVRQNHGFLGGGTEFTHGERCFNNNVLCRGIKKTFVMNHIDHILNKKSQNLQNRPPQLPTGQRSVGGLEKKAWIFYFFQKYFCCTFWFVDIHCIYTC